MPRFPFLPSGAPGAAPIIALCFGTAVVVLDGGVANVALPTIARDLHVANSQAVLVVTLYQLTIVMCVLPFAAIGERIGLKRFYQGGLVAFAITSLAALFVQTLPQLLALRMLHAASAAACLSVSVAMIRTLYRPEHLGRGLGLNAIIISASAAFAPTLGGFLVGTVHWTWLFVVAAPFALASLLLGRLLPDPPPRRAAFDFLGAALTAATIGGIVIGMQIATKSSPEGGIALIAGAMALAVILVRYERRIAYPVLPVDLLARRVIAISALAGMTVFAAQMLLLVSLPFRLEHAFGLPPAEVGVLVAAWPMTTLFVAPTAGVLADRVHPGLLGAIGMTLAITGLLLVAYLPVDAHGFNIAWRISLCGLGFALFMTPNARLIVGFAPATRAAAAGGLVSTIRLAGQTTGATMVAALLAVGMGEGRVPLFVAVGLALFAALCSASRIGTPTKRVATVDAAEAESDAAG